MENLEKQSVDYVTRTGEMIKGVVAGYDQDVGITIVAEEDHSKILYCLLGPSSVQYKEAGFRNENGENEKLFSFITEAIKAGVFDTRELKKIHPTGNRYKQIPQSQCAFSR